MSNEKIFFAQLCTIIALGYGVMGAFGFAFPSEQVPDGWRVPATISGVAALIAAGLYLTSESHEEQHSVVHA